MYDQYAYYHYETVEEKPVPKPPQLVPLSDERAARQRRDEKGLCSFYLKCSEGELHLPSSVCPRDFLGELEYWGLSALHLGLHFNLVKLQSNVMQNIFTIQRI